MILWSSDFFFRHSIAFVFAQKCFTYDFDDLAPDIHQGKEGRTENCLSHDNKVTTVYSRASGSVRLYSEVNA